jgi:hypothetical protein
MIWPDHDAVGEKYARDVATILVALDCSVAIIDAKALAAIDPAGGAREPRDKWDAANVTTEWMELAALRVEVEKGRGETKTKANEWVAAPFEILAECRDPHGRG